ncbi:MAG: fibronectin type III domain-containing protein [Acidobacteria bacterium]|nr:MAG: fibronectin type III domain-containing protein [Acidobacteriota bacterium]
MAALVPGPQVALGWRDNATDETGYVIERSANGGLYQAIASVSRTTLAGGYIDRTVAPGNSYSYHVMAVNGWLSSGFSNSASVTVPAVPAAPSNLAGSAARAGLLDTVTLTWTDNATNEAGFQVQRSTAPEFNAGLVNYAAGTNVRTFTDRLARRGVVYYYRVRAANLGGTSSWSNTASVKTP